MDSEVKAFQEDKLRKLAEKPNTTVFTVKHDEINKPWPVKRVRKVLENIAKRVNTEFSESDSDFKVRKKCLDDSEILEFQRKHPKLYWMVTDREKMKNEKYRSAVSALLEVKMRVERGDIPDGNEADAAATRTVIDALS